MEGLWPQPKYIYLGAVASLRTGTVNVAPAGTCWMQAAASPPSPAAVSLVAPSAHGPSEFVREPPPRETDATAVTAAVIPARRTTK